MNNVATRKTHTYRKMWTKDDFKKMLDMWESHSIQDIANDIGVSRPVVSAMATRMRKMGFKLSQKRQNGYLEHLLGELLEESRGY